MRDEAALSALDWWAEAGVDTLVDNAPFDWFASAAPAPAKLAQQPPPPVVASDALPDTLAAFRSFLLVDARVPGPVRGRLDASGDAGGGAIIVVDMPEAEDRAAGALLAGETGALFDRMLAAIQLDRTNAYLLPFSPARPAAGRLRDEERQALTPLLLHHLTLAQPKRLLLLGDAPVLALLGRPVAGARETAHAVTLGDRSVPTVASFHPRLVRTREARASAWADLQRFAGL